MRQSTDTPASLVVSDLLDVERLAAALLNVQQLENGDRRLRLDQGSPADQSTFRWRAATLIGELQMQARAGAEDTECQAPGYHRRMAVMELSMPRGAADAGRQASGVRRPSPDGGLGAADVE